MAPSAGAAVQETLYSGYIAEGEKVARFTKLIADYVGNPRTVLVNSCTTALTVAYRLAGVEPGTEVISTPLTCIASNEPIIALGGKPVWADVDPETGMIDPDDIEHLVNEKTRAILVLHKEGDPARLDEILAIAKKHNLKVIEDAAHAIGTEYKGRRIGNHGDYVCFSFQAIKQLATGDGGALLCKSEDDFHRARKMKWFGMDRENSDGKNIYLQDIDDYGFKGNMNDISATIGIEQMKHINDIIRSHHTNGELYSDLLANTPGIALIRRDKADYGAYWAYCLMVENRSDFEIMLQKQGIASSQVHPRNDIYSIFSESKRELPNVDKFSKIETSLPCGWWVTPEDVQRICDVIKKGW